MKARAAILVMAVIFLMACSTQAFAFARVFRACFKSLLLPGVPKSVHPRVRGDNVPPEV